MSPLLTSQPPRRRGRRARRRLFRLIGSDATSLLPPTFFTSVILAFALTLLALLRL